MKIRSIRLHRRERQILLVRFLIVIVLLSVSVFFGEINSSNGINVFGNKYGIPLIDYGLMDGVYIGLQANPLFISTSAYDNYNLYLDTGTEVYKQNFLNGANWLINNAVDHGNYSILEYHFPWPQYNLTSPWQSSMAQASAARTLTKAYQATGDMRYIESAKKLINSFFVEVKDGGVTYKTPDKGWWYEEYAASSNRQPRVLHGMLYSVIGIYDYYKYTNDTDAKYLFDQGLKSLKSNLRSYDYSKYFYTYYDHENNTSPLYYHTLTVDLLYKIYKISNVGLFKAYADRWNDYKIPELTDKSPKILLDKNGIPIVDYKVVRNTTLGLQRNPVTITHTALDQYSNYLISGNQTEMRSFLNNADWLIQNEVHHTNYSIFDYNFPWPEYNLNPPWHSSMAQARALQVLVRAHQLTHDEKYLLAAKNLLNAFFIDVNNGGVTYKNNNNGWWYELFAGEQGKKPRVLNGMLYSVIGIYDYYKYTNDTDAKYLFDQGLKSLKMNLGDYNYKKTNYTNYDILGTTNPLGYHKLHIKLLQELYDITNDGTIRYYLNKWIHYQYPEFLKGQKCRLNC